MKSAHRQRARPNQARYAHLSALLKLRIAELEAALDRDELDHQNWDQPEVLVGVDRILADALALIARRPRRTALRNHEGGHRS